jgi:hypothetical protein
MRALWGRLGGQLGVGFIVLGFAAVFLGWNGAASSDRVPSQFPYLLSGGVTGLCLVVVGAALLLVQNQREDRAKLQAALEEIHNAMERMAAASGTDVSASDGSGNLVAAGPNSYHKLGCRLLEGRGPLPTMTVEKALAQGLNPCRTCKPPAGAEDATAEMAPVRKRRSRSS